MFRQSRHSPKVFIWDKILNPSSTPTSLGYANLLLFSDVTFVNQLFLELILRLHIVKYSFPLAFDPGMHLIVSVTPHASTS